MNARNKITHRSSHWKVGGGGLLALALGTGCFVSDGGGGGYEEPYDYSPEITSVDVFCDYDAAYGDYYWDFYTTVYDPDYDVVDVYVEIIDYATGAYLETFDLVYDGGDQYSNRIYESYSGYLTCPYVEDNDYDFYAYDSLGYFDSARYTYL